MKCNALKSNSAHVFIRPLLDILNVGSDNLLKKNQQYIITLLAGILLIVAIYYLIVQAARLPATVGWHKGHHLVPFKFWHLFLNCFKIFP